MEEMKGHFVLLQLQFSRIPENLMRVKISNFRD